MEDIKSYLKINRAEFVLGEFGWSFVLTWTQKVYLLSGRVCARQLIEMANHTRKDYDIEVFVGWMTYRMNMYV